MAQTATLVVVVMATQTAIRMAVTTVHLLMVILAAPARTEVVAMVEQPEAIKCLTWALI